MKNFDHVSKQKNWQDVSIAEIRKHEWDEVEQCTMLELSRYANAIAWDNEKNCDWPGIPGCGIGIRCTYQQDVVDCWHNTTNVVKTHNYLVSMGWEIGEYDGDSALVAIKGDTKVQFDCDGGSTAFLSVDYIGDEPLNSRTIEKYYDSITK